jgi:hypothetical protein
MLVSPPQQRASPIVRRSLQSGPRARILHPVRVLPARLQFLIFRPGASGCSDPVESAVAVAFGGFQAVAQVQQFILHGAAFHVVDGDG